MQESKNNNEVNELEIVKDVLNFHSSVLPDFTAEWNESKDLVNLIFGDHWTQDQKQAHEQIGTKARDIAVLFPMFLKICGLEKETRDKFVADAVGKEDELAAYITNIRFRHWESANNPRYDYIKSDVFADHLFNGYGVIAIDKKKTATGEEDLSYRYVPYNNIVFDRNFTDQEMTNCSRKQEFEWVYYDELKAMYPNIAPFPELNTQGFDNTNAGLKDLKDYYSYQSPNNNNSKKLTKIIKDEKIVWKQVYEVHSIKTDEPIEECDTMKIAKEYVRNKMRPIREENKMSPAPVSIKIDDYYQIKPVMKKRIEFTIVAGRNVIADTEILPYEESKYKFLWGYFFQGKWWSWVRIMRDFQHFVDKIISMLDYSMGIDTKTVFQLVVKNIDTDYMSVPEALNAVATGGTIPSKTGDDVIKRVAREGSRPEYFNFLTYLLQLRDDAVGSKNFYGGQETSSESGKAIQERKQAAFGIYINTLDNLHRFEEQVGKFTLTLAKEVNTPKFVKKVLGKDVTDNLKTVLANNKIYQDSLFEQGYGYLMLEDTTQDIELTLPDGNTTKQRSLTDANLIINVKKVQTSINEKDELLNKIAFLSKQYGFTPPPEMVADLLDLDPVTADKYVQNIRQKEQANAQMQQQQLELNKAGVMAQVAKNAGDLASKEITSPQPREQAVSDITSTVLQK